jgi:WhiB family redox-sensing transcriptional regulator
MVATAPALNPDLCRVCGAPNPPSRGGGRPRRYCSDDCARAGTKLKSRARETARRREVVPFVPIDLGRAHGWEGDALCLEYDPALWFPEGQGSGWQARQAKEICGRCLVRAECLTMAILEGLSLGIFGGTTGPERQRMRVAGVDAVKASESRRERARRLEAEYPELTEEEEEAAEEAEHEAWLAQFD